jgi:hypothetical protein
MVKLSQKDIDLLATLYETPMWNAFKRQFIEDRITEISVTTPFLPDLEGLHIARGRIMELKQIELQMKSIHEKQDKRRKKNG